MNGQILIQTALENLQQNTGITGRWKALKGLTDGGLIIKAGINTFNFHAEVKREVRPQHIESILRKKAQFGDDLIVIAEKLFPKAKAELRELCIPYLEANGNLFIKRNGTLIWIDANPPLRIKQQTGNRAFTKTGLKVLFHFLLDQSLVNYPQRKIAVDTGVSLGNIPQIIRGLKETGYLLQLNKDSYVWEDRPKLLDRWIADYETILRPTLLLGRFTFNGDYSDIRFITNQTVWGGEFAADRLTNHLRPEEFTIYTKETKQELIRNYKFMPKDDGEFFAYQWFWENHPFRENIAPYLLIYADLMIKGDKRSKETAQLIFNEYLRDII